MSANTIDDLAALKYPYDRARLRLLSPTAFQMWYATQSPQAMIFLGQDPDFQRFLFWNYTLRVRVLRFAYRIKRFFLETFLSRSTLTAL